MAGVLVVSSGAGCLPVRGCFRARPESQFPVEGGVVEVGQVHSAFLARVISRTI